MADDDLPFVPDILEGGSDIETDDPVPGFAQNVDSPTAGSVAGPRKRGWPKGKPRGPRKPRTTTTQQLPPSTLEKLQQTFSAAQDTETEAPKSYVKTEVQARLEQIILGVTGIPGAWRPYFQATPNEAKNMAEPLSSYLIRQAPQSAFVRRFLDEFDIFTFIMACIAYMVRVINDHRAYRRKQLAEQARVVDTPSHRTVKESRPTVSDPLAEARYPGTQPGSESDETNASDFASRSLASHPIVPGL